MPSSTTSTIEPKLSNLITGIYDYQSSVNFDNYLKQLGVNYVLRKLAALASPTVTIGTNCQDHEKHVSNLKFLKLCHEHFIRYYIIGALSTDVHHFPGTTLIVKFVLNLVFLVLFLSIKWLAAHHETSIFLLPCWLFYKHVQEGPTTQNLIPT